VFSLLIRKFNLPTPGREEDPDRPGETETVHTETNQGEGSSAPDGGEARPKEDPGPAG